MARLFGTYRIAYRWEGALITRSQALQPGLVPFHRPELIQKPELEGFWEPGSVEAFWKSNKVVLAPG